MVQATIASILPKTQCNKGLRAGANLCRLDTLVYVHTEFVPGSHSGTEVHKNEELIYSVASQLN